MARVHRIRQTTAGTYTIVIPAGVTTLEISGCGAGGGGGGGGMPAATTASRGNGGHAGGGATCGRVLVTVTPGATYFYTVGAAGTGGAGASVAGAGTDGTDGSDTTFGTSPVLARFKGAAGGLAGRASGVGITNATFGLVAGTTIAGYRQGFLWNYNAATGSFESSAKRHGDGGIGGWDTGTPGTAPVYGPDDGIANGANTGGAKGVTGATAGSYLGGFGGGGGGVSNAPGAVAGDGGTGGAASNGGVASAGTAALGTPTLGSGGGGGGGGGAGATSGIAGAGSNGAAGYIEITWWQ